MRLIEDFRYRPEIDGLRAVAVLVVVLYHAGFGCPGGYVGVDVFFVISGFLITSLIWKDLETGRFTFAQFWERRARRIVPALVVVTLATLLGGWFLLMPEDFKSLGRAAAAQALFSANIHYWFDSGYFAGAAEEKPLLHTWSLAVEEQFYFVMPMFSWAIFQVLMLRTRAVVIALLSIGIFASFAMSAYGMMRNPAATFYLLPTRAWELLSGSLVAFLTGSSVTVRRSLLREGAAFVGLALILVPVFVYTRETPFPGLAAIPPCAGTALIIWANRRKDQRIPTLIGKVLAMGPIVFVGLISYSLYLWHWPLLAFSKYVSFTPLSIGTRAALVGLGFVLATWSWKYIETPFRTRRLGATRRAVFTYAGTGLAAALLLGWLCFKLQGVPLRFPPLAQEYANASSDVGYQIELSVADVRAEMLTPLGVPGSALRPSLLVWGDSHAMAALPAFDAFLKEKGWTGRAATHSSTAPVLNWFTRTQFGYAEEALIYNDAVFSYVRKYKIPLVILSANWKGYIQRGAEEGGTSNTFNVALLATVRRLAAIGSRPLILLDVPVHTFNVPRGLSRSIISGANIDALSTKPTVAERFDTLDVKVVEEIKAAGGRFLDPKPSFLSPTGQHYIVQSNGIALYSDEQHLTTKGSILVLLPFLRASLAGEIH